MSINDVFAGIRGELDKFSEAVSGEARRALETEVERLKALHQDVMTEAVKLRPKLDEVLAAAEPAARAAAVTLANEFISYLSATLGIPIPPLPVPEPAPAAPAEAPPAQPEAGSEPPAAG